MLAIERKIQTDVVKLQQNIFANLGDKTINDVLANYELLTGKKLTAEQNNAVRHIVGKESISCIVGRAGTGKSFSLAAAKAIWDDQGNQVLGVALSGIAADGLVKDANMNSRTIASFLLSVDNGSVKLDSKTVIVMDEAGMTDSLSMQKVLSLAQNARAKIVLVGDPAQLQPVGPGASFRAILEKIGFAEIQTVYRQKEQWQRDATVEFSKANTGNAIQAYYDHGCVHFSQNAAQAIDHLVTDWQAKRSETGKDAAKFLIVAHRNADVQSINHKIRDMRVAKSEVAEGYSVKNMVAGTERKIKIAQNDRILFLKNDKKLGVANGRFATITYVNFTESGKVIGFNVKLDGTDNEITINPNSYQDFDYGYAATVHKTQGVTVDHSFVYGGGNLNSSLTYVAMTRHKETTALYASSGQYQNLNVLKERVSRLDTKDSVLNYIDQIDDYAGRRGLETNQKTLKQVLVDSLVSVKNKLIAVFQEPSIQNKENQTISKEQQAAAKETPLSFRQESAQNKQPAIAVAEYVQARRNYAIAYDVLLKKYGISELPKESEALALISNVPEYKEFVASGAEIGKLAYTVSQNMEQSAGALQLNKVDVGKLQTQAYKYETKLRLISYASALKDNTAERYKIAYSISQDIKGHYAAIKTNNIDMQQINHDCNEVVLTYLLDKAGIKDLADKSPAISVIDVVRQTKTNISIEEKELQSFLTEYLEAEIIQSHLFKENLTNHTHKEQLQQAIEKLNQLRTTAAKTDIYTKLAHKYNPADYTLLKRPKLNGGAVPAYQRALQGKSTADDYAAIRQEVAKLVHQQQQMISKSMKR